jgi:hypothetical protein
MRSVDYGSRLDGRLAVHRLTYQSTDDVKSSIDLEMAIAVLLFAVRPDKAGVAIIKPKSLKKKL